MPELQPLRKTLLGVKLIYFAIMSSLILVCASPVLAFGIASFGLGPIKLWQLETAVALLLGYVWLLVLVGQVLTASVPTEFGGKLCAQISAALTGLSLAVLIALFGYSTIITRSQGEVSQIVAAGGIANTAIQVIGLLLFMCFARQTSSLLGNHIVARKFGSSTTLILFCVFLYGAFYVTTIAMSQTGKNGQGDVQWIPYLFLGTALLVGVFTFFRFVNALRELALELTKCVRDRSAPQLSEVATNR